MVPSGEDCAVNVVPARVSRSQYGGVDAGPAIDVVAPPSVLRACAVMPCHDGVTPAKTLRAGREGASDHHAGLRPAIRIRHARDAGGDRAIAI